MFLLNTLHLTACIDPTIWRLYAAVGFHPKRSEKQHRTASGIAVWRSLPVRRRCRGIKQRAPHDWIFVSAGTLCRAKSSVGAGPCPSAEGQLGRSSSFIFFNPHNRRLPLAPARHLVWFTGTLSFCMFWCIPGATRVYSVAVVGGAAAVYFMGAPPLDAPEEVQSASLVDCPNTPYCIAPHAPKPRVHRCLPGVVTVCILLAPTRMALKRRDVHRLVMPPSLAPFLAAPNLT